MSEFQPLIDVHKGNPDILHDVVHLAIIALNLITIVFVYWTRHRYKK